MKAAFVDDNKVVIKEVQEPKIGRNDLLVRMKACGICGSDLEKVYGRYGVVSRRLGHEPSGEIIAVGDNIKDFNIGDRVFVHHHVPCYECHYCKHGDHTMCKHYQKSNIEPCGLSELFLVPEWNIVRGGVIKLPDHVSFEEAAMIEPLACCIRAIDKIGIMKDDNIAVIGVGPAGMMQIMLAKLYGARTFAIDINEFRLKFAKTNGADYALNVKDDVRENAIRYTDNIGMDAVIVSTGHPSAFELALQIIRSGGKIILFGVPAKNTSIELDLNHIFTNEIKILPSLAASEIETRKAFELISEKKIDIDKIITHKFRLEDSNKAFELAHKGIDAMKIVITN
ncbi:MAG: alcohol dehydrogenase [Candidatus Nitrosocaldaceae archaeon]|nr:MAG: alcohol dehydrogenase [Candidatus Nitrosocaldaceae archaeon]